MNLVLFYQDSKFQARVAANYLSKQYQGTFSHWSFTAPNAGLAQWQDETLYIDAGASFDFNEHFQVFLQGPISPRKRRQTTCSGNMRT